MSVATPSATDRAPLWPYARDREGEVRLKTEQFSMAVKNSSSEMEDSMRETKVGHCKQDDVDVYVGRGKGGRDMIDCDVGERGWLGNPYTLEENSREESIAKFREAFRFALKHDEELRESVAELKGKKLGCWCQRLDEDGPACHGEVIAEWADRLGE